MNLFNRFWGKMKQKNSAQNTSRTIAPKMEAQISQRAGLENSIGTETFKPTPAGRVCADDAHDFVFPYPFKCKKCGVECTWDGDLLRKYMGSYFDGVAYQWTQTMDDKDIVSFSLSTGERPVLSAECDFSSLTIRNSLNGSRDGWMQSQYPQGYFDTKEILLKEDDIQKLRSFFENCNFFGWKTPVHYVENIDAPGFFVNKRFHCTFSDGKQFECLKPDDAEFERLVSLLRQAAQSNAQEEQKFIERMLSDTKTKEKQIYWLISCCNSMEGKWMEILEQGVPYFHYRVSRDMLYRKNANAQLCVNVIRFSTGAAWVTDTPVPAKDYRWESLPVGERNDVGAAFSLLAERFETLPAPTRKLFPVVMLVLDGSATDDYMTALKRYRSLPGVKQNALTCVIALGDHVDEKLLKDIGSPVFNVRSIDDFIDQLDSPLFSM